MGQVKLSIITAAHNNPEQLKKFLESLKVIADQDSGIEIVVVDDHSAADMKAVTDNVRDVKYIRLDAHGGPAKARNTGARSARGNFLIFFDSDVTVKRDTLAKFNEHFDRGEVAVAGEYDPEPMEAGFFPRFKSLIAESWIPRSRYVSIFLLRAAGIRADIFNKVGGFDENITTASVEDYEFGDKLAKAGIKIFYDPSILVRHHHPGFIKQARLFYLRARDWTDIFFKRRGRFDNMCATPAEALSSVSGALFIISIAVAIMTGSVALYAISFAAFVVYVFSNIAFLSVVHKRRGILFMPVALLIKLPLSLMVTLGFAAGVFRFVAAKFRRKTQKP